MSQDADATPQYHAVLIGIDDYMESPLNSCVRDVDNMTRYLQDTLGSEDLHCHLLTARRPNDNDETKSVSSAHNNKRPTMRNLIRCLETVADLAQPKDFVYIHYSGHGTRLDPDFDYSNQSTGDLALVLLTDHEIQESELKGPRLAGLINRMVKKGLVVTVVLDCCFSASVYGKSNGDSTVRYLPSKRVSSSTRKSDYHDENNAEDCRPSSSSYLRSASMRDNWLMNPDGYTILAACGPMENAKGVAVEMGDEATKKPQGALSYLLLQALQRYGLGRKHKDIFRHLTGHFWKSGQPQHPVLYGNGDQAFFGTMDDDRASRSICVVEKDGKLRMLAGQAHGILSGDKVALYAAYTLRDRGIPQESMTVRISRAGPLTSELEIPTLDHSNGVMLARLVSSSELAKSHVRLPENVLNLEEWRKEIMDRSMSISAGDNLEPELRVVLTEHGEYIIFHRDEQVLLPFMPHEKTSISHICDILRHMAQFEMVKTLKNLTLGRAFEESFRVWMSSDEGDFAPDGSEQIILPDDAVIRLNIENLSTTDLYVCVLELGRHQRSIKSILKSTHEVVVPRDIAPTRYHGNGSKSSPRGGFSRKLRMKVPSELQKIGYCEDIIKVFITTKPTLFDILELPGLVGGLDDALRSNGHSRSAPLQDDGEEDWVAFNFSIRTVLAVRSEDVCYEDGSSDIQTGFEGIGMDAETRASLRS